MTLTGTSGAGVVFSYIVLSSCAEHGSSCIYYGDRLYNTAGTHHITVESGPGPGLIYATGTGTCSGVTSAQTGQTSYSVTVGGTVTWGASAQNWRTQQTIRNDTLSPVRITFGGYAPVTIQPGDSRSWDESLVQVAQPPNTPIVKEVYLGDGQWTTEQIMSAPWSVTPTPTTSPVIPDITPTTPPPTTTYAPAVATTLATTLDKQTFQTGVDSGTSAQVQGSRSIVEAVDKVRLAVNASTNRIPDSSSLASSASAGATTARNSIGTALGNGAGIIDGWGTVPTPSTPGGGFFDIPIRYGNTSVNINWLPTASAHGGALLSFGRSMIAWVAWILYAGWALWLGIGMLQLAALTPQGTTSSNTPVLSSGVALVLAAIVVGLVAALAVIVVAAVIALISASGLATAAMSWQTWSMTLSNRTVSVGDIMGMADMFVPIWSLLAMPMAAIVFQFGLAGSAVGISAGIRAIAG